MNLQITDIIILILVIVVAIASTFVSYNMIRALHRLSVAPDLPAARISLKESSEYNLQLHRLIVQLKYLLNCCKVVVARFHNGGNYFNGMAMMKFSVYMDSPSENSTIPNMIENYRDVLNSRYPIAFSQLVTFGEYICSDVDDCTDINFKNDMKKCGYKSTNLFLVKQLNGTEEGFIGINYKDTHVMTPEEKDIVRQELTTVRGLLNMVIEITE